MTKKKERSSAYPALPLDEAIKSLSELSRNLGSGPYSREVAAQAMGYKGVSGASARKIAALVHFGLLEKGGSTYKQSVLGKRILFPQSELEKEEAQREAFRQPKLYLKLIERYGEKSLPQMLQNILIQEFAITPPAAREAARVFRSSAEAVGMLKNGVLASVSQQSPVPRPEEEKIITDVTASEKVASFPESKNIAVNLPSGIIVIFPSKMSYKVGQGKFAGLLDELEAASGETITKPDSDSESEEKKEGDQLSL